MFDAHLIKDCASRGVASRQVNIAPGSGNARHASWGNAMPAIILLEYIYHENFEEVGGRQFLAHRVGPQVDFLRRTQQGRVFKDLRQASYRPICRRVASTFRNRRRLLGPIDVAGQAGVEWSWLGTFSMASLKGEVRVL